MIGTNYGYKCCAGNLYNRKPGAMRNSLLSTAPGWVYYHGNIYLLTTILYTEAPPWRFNNLI